MRCIGHAAAWHPLHHPASPQHKANNYKRPVRDHFLSFLPSPRPFIPCSAFPRVSSLERKKNHISHSPQHSQPGLHFLTKFKVSKFTSPYIEVHNLLLTPWYIELTQTVIFPTFCSSLGSFITLQTLQRNVTMFSGHRPVMIGAARAWASIAQG